MRVNTLNDVQHTYLNSSEITRKSSFDITYTYKHLYKQYSY